MNDISLPAGWRWVRIADLTSVRTGKTPSRQKPHYYGQEIPWVKTTEVTDSVIYETEEHLSKEGQSENKCEVFPPDSIIIAMYGQGQTRGRTALLGIPATTNQACAVLLPSKQFDTRYLWLYLRGNYERLRDLGRGGNQPNLNLGIVGDFTVPLPPLEEQRRIAAILDKADAVRRKRKEAIALTEELLRSAFLEMFGNPVTNPKGWEMKPLGKLCTVRRGASPRPIDAYLGGSVPWVKIGDGTGSDDIYIHKTAEAVTPEGAKKSVYLEPGSLIFANCGVSLGFARILGIGGCIHDGWLSFSDISESLDKIYLLKLLNSVTNHFRQIAPSGTQPNLNTGIMKEFSIPIPPIQLQLEFADVVEKISSEKQHQSEALEATENLFNSLLQRAFRGEL